MAERQHLVFYDGSCGMCHWVVQFLLKHDSNKLFVFAPLQGETAQLLLKDWRTSVPEADSLVLIENYQGSEAKKIYIFGKGALRIFWLLGGFWAIPGCISFLPSFLYDWKYRWVARHRFQWFASESCLIPKTQDATRFLS
ncbi:MAG: DUF393 domain-containing protein [Parachlamydiaceae bacterium]|nr:DUF393 domain-containing protein [Parachlamydiaceae bacterium]